MKHLAIVTSILLTSTTAFADTTRATVEDHYKQVTKRIPHTVQVCNTVEVPVYGSGGFDQGDAIVGGIVGGLLGSQIGKGNGNKAATGAGAIAGAIIGGKKDDQVVGYRQEQRCSNQTSYTTETETVYNYSTIKFYNDGKEYLLSFQK